MMVRNPSRLVVAFALLFGAGFALGCSGEDPGSSEADAKELSNGIFKSTTALPFKLSAPFAKLFERFRNGQADPPKADDGADKDPADNEPTYSEPGTLTYRGKPLDVLVSIRGHTSPRDCTFPKYKIEFTDKDQISG